MKKLHLFTFLLFLTSFGSFAQSLPSTMLSLGTSFTGDLTGMHYEAGIGTSIHNYRVSARYAHNFSQTSQYSIDVLYSTINFKRLRILSGVEYTYSTFATQAIDGYLIPDYRGKENVCIFLCGNSVITDERQYGESGTIALPFYLESDIGKYITVYGNYSYLFGDHDKIRFGLMYRLF